MRGIHRICKQEITTQKIKSIFNKFPLMWLWNKKGLITTIKLLTKSITNNEFYFDLVKTSNKKWFKF